MIILIDKKLDEKLVRATDGEFELLQAQMAENSKLDKQLSTPLENLPQYKYLYNQDYVGAYALFDLLDFIARKERSKAILYFSKAGSIFTGFLVYTDNGKIINNLKMASFYDDQAKANRQMANDLKMFIGDKMKAHELITWEAEKENPVNKLSKRRFLYGTLNTVLASLGINVFIVQYTKFFINRNNTAFTE
jgi:hypothetical protein